MATRRTGLIHRRKLLGYTQEQLAERLRVDRTTLARWERGETDPQPWFRPKLARTFRLSVEELDLLLAETAPQQGTVGLPCSGRSAVVRSGHDDEWRHEGEQGLHGHVHLPAGAHAEVARYGSTLGAAGEDVRRREVLRLGLLGALPGATSDALRISLDALVGERDADDWELALLDHSHAILSQRPEDVYASVLDDLAILGQQLKRERSRDLLSVMTRLSAHAANLTARLGGHETSRQWWGTARRASDASGDRALAASVRGVEAAFALYAPRPVKSVLLLTRSALEIAGGSAEGALCAAGAQAQALALMGRVMEAQHALADLSDSSSAGAGHGWTPDTLSYVATWVHAYTGSEDDCAEACQRVIATSTSYQNIANARLHEAIAAARLGAHGRAFAIGSQIIDGLEPGYRTHMVMSTARRVIEVIPPADRKTGPARDYAALVSGCQ